MNQRREVFFSLKTLTIFPSKERGPKDGKDTIFFLLPISSLHFFPSRKMRRVKKERKWMKSLKVKKEEKVFSESSEKKNLVLSFRNKK